MIRSAVRALVLLSIIAAPGSIDAQGKAAAKPAPARLVNTEWLAARLGDPNLVVLHVTSRAQFDSAHVTGARQVALSDIEIPRVQGALSLQLASVEQLTEWITRVGITDKSRIVVVPHDSALQSSARVVLTLAYLGALDSTSMLDGTFQAWKKEGRATVTTPAPAPVAGVFTPRLRPELIATMQQVESATQDQRSTIVDSRLTKFFEGDGGGFPRPGRIPTAVSVPMTSVSTNGYFKPVAELRALFTAAGATGSKPIITYCHIGQQASLVWFAATMAGLDAKMYDGSFQEWSGTSRLPVVAPPM